MLLRLLSLLSFVLLWSPTDAVYAEDAGWLDPVATLCRAAEIPHRDDEAALAESDAETGAEGKAERDGDPELSGSMLLGDFRRSELLVELLRAMLRNPFGTSSESSRDSEVSLGLDSAVVRVRSPRGPPIV